jgi:adenylyltransferase/sulfurtransferase
LLTESLLFGKLSSFAFHYIRQMNFNRYSRQTILKGFGEEGQRKLADARVLIIGAGGLGVPVLTYLNAMGIGTLGIVDNDNITLSNLHRQVLYNEDTVGESKAEAAKKQLIAQNSNTAIIVHKTFLVASNALEIIRDYDVVVDATDNFPARYLINDACVILKKPFVYGALHGFEGQVSVFNYKNGPTYRCLFPTMPKADEVPNCNEHGVLGILPGIIGNLQALEAIKVIAGIGNVLSGTLLLYDGLAQHFQKMKFKQDPKNLRINTLASSYDFTCEVKVKSIAASKIPDLLKNNGIQLLDVRTTVEYAQNHLKKSTNIPLHDLEAKAHDLNLGQVTYLICQSGKRSQKALIILQELFPEKEFVQVEGGMNKIDSYANTH